MTPLGVLGWVLAVLGVLAVLVLVFINVRAQRLNRTIGSFSSALQVGDDGKWYAGVGQYGAETLTWYRLVSMSNRPYFVLARRTLELSPARPHGTVDGMLEVTITSGDEQWDLAVDPQTFNGLVSWVESGAPHHTAF